MNEDDKTKNLPNEDAPTAEPTFEQRVMARFDALDNRLSALEERVDARLRDTRPIWEAVNTQLEQINDKLSILNDHILTTQADLTSLTRRVERLEGERKM